MPESDMSVWTGRVDTADGPNALRWHQMVKALTPGAEPGIVLIGFACDEGVRRNGGRVGAKDGPQAIRAALANLAWHQHFPVYDAGDVRCDDCDMEGAQSRLAEIVANAIRAGHRVLVLGGGHETAWGTFQGIVAAKPDANLGVVNIDAHLDLRADEPGNSGTPFNQMARWFEAHGRPFRYFCAGVAWPSNTPALFDRARAIGAEWASDFEFHPHGHAAVAGRVGAFLRTVRHVHMSLDLDALPCATMPAVSAPAARGVELVSVDALACGVITNTETDTLAVDVCEYNPALDPDGRGARTAALLVWRAALALGWGWGKGHPGEGEP